ncbi:MAG: hypothetical protein P4L80_02635 [Xanthobacteraceae bacterium]|nr:hypothetical protein [Xanthobacteraceae bacterium]
MASPRKRELSVYDGQDCIGTIKVADDGSAVAYRRGKRIGSFSSFEAASAAFDSQSTAPGSSRD